MKKIQKLIISGALITALTVSGTSAFAQSANDIDGSANEMAISKIVSIGYVSLDKGKYNPEKTMTRSDFAVLATKALKLSSKKKKTVKDFKGAAATKTALSTVAGHNLLSISSKGAIKPSQAITYKELVKTLAVGLGFKTSWSSKHVDYLFYLDRMGVVDISVNLDAKPTKGEVAEAFDNYLTLKSSYKVANGIVSAFTPTTLTIKSVNGDKTYKLDKDVAAFKDESSTDVGSYGKGTAVSAVLNSKNEIGFISAYSVDLLDGVFTYGDFKLGVGLDANKKPLKTLAINPDVVVERLPSNPKADFTLTELAGYSNADVTFNGGAYYNVSNDEITYIQPFIEKVEAPVVLKAGNVIEADFSGVALANLNLSIDEEFKVFVKANAEDKEPKESTLEAFAAVAVKDAGTTATLELSKSGTITAITYLIAPKKEEAAK